MNMDKPIDLASLKRGGVLQQKDRDYYLFRIHVTAGNVNADILRAVASVAERYGNGSIHITSRQSIEIPFIPLENIEIGRSELKRMGLELSNLGPCVRTVTGCPGSLVCKFGIMNTRELCEAIDRQFAGQELPHKLKIGVTGCRNSCLKPQENDIGLMGVIGPNNQRGWALFLGGRIGKQPKLGERYGPVLSGTASAIAVIQSIIELFREHGKRGERFGVALERIPVVDIEARIVRVVESLSKV